MLARCQRAFAPQRQDPGSERRVRPVQTFVSNRRREITAIGPYAAAIHLDRDDQCCESRWQRCGSRLHVLCVRGSHTAEVNDLRYFGQETHRVEARASAGRVRQHDDRSGVPACHRTPISGVRGIARILLTFDGRFAPEGLAVLQRCREMSKYVIRPAVRRVRLAELLAD